MTGPDNRNGADHLAVVITVDRPSVWIERVYGTGQWLIIFGIKAAGPLEQPVDVGWASGPMVSSAPPARFIP
jgi:hypothetical protein